MGVVRPRGYAFTKKVIKGFAERNIIAVRKNLIQQKKTRKKIALRSENRACAGERATLRVSKKTAAARLKGVAAQVATVVSGARKEL